MQGRRGWPCATPAYINSGYWSIRIVQTGSHVICAMTGKSIPLDELRYWSVARQEAYVDAAASLEAEKKAGTLPA